MAVGLQTQSDSSTLVIRLIDGQTTTNSPPATYAGAGVDVGAILDAHYGNKSRPKYCHVVGHTSAGSGTMTATNKLWSGYLGLAASGAGKYVAASPGTAALAGVLNGGAAFDEHATDDISRADILSFLGVVPRKMYNEVTAIGGTGTAFVLDLVFPAVPL